MKATNAMVSPSSSSELSTKMVANDPSTPANTPPVSPAIMLFLPNCTRGDTAAALKGTGRPSPAGSGGVE